VARAVKDELVVAPSPDGEGGLAFTYDFRLAPVAVAAPV